ncbi:MAG: hypothetical protein AB8G16_06045 [Gammaproteobacteria bacterium]
MKQQEFEQWLDQAANDMPTSIEPERDLWPDISARMLAQDVEPTTERSRLWPFVAGIAATLLATVGLQSMREAPQATPEEVAQSVIYLEQPPAWVPEIKRTANRLQDDYQAGLDQLPPQTREVVEQNLRQIHESLAEIHAALAADPGNLALHRLLAGTYQQEIELISTIGTITPPESEL